MIRNNFGIIRANSSKAPEKFEIKKSSNSRNLAINNALQEIEINTPDSIRLAFEALESKSIEIPTVLRVLKEMQLSGQIRDKAFGAEVKNLKTMAIEAVKALLQEGPKAKDA